MGDPLPLISGPRGRSLTVPPLPPSMSNKLYWIRPTHLIVSVDSPLLRSLLGWKEGPSTPVSNDNVLMYVARKPETILKGMPLHSKGVARTMEVLRTPPPLSPSSI